MAFRSLMSAILLAGALVAGAPLSRRAVIPHDQVVGFPQTVPSDFTGTLALKYKPHLWTSNGCVPFPAVSPSGDVNGGLAPTGWPSGGCTSSPGQIYSRSATYNDRYAILYAWYWPKDQLIPGLGHRHDWESIVVWLSDESMSASFLGLAVSAHGGYATSTSPDLSGSSPLIQYVSYFPLNHQLDFIWAKGGQQPLIAWESMPAVAQQALADTDWGAANVPFTEANFLKNLGKASL